MAPIHRTMHRALNSAESRQYAARGFTVVELLVVIATIAVLLSFSIPAFRRLMADSSRTRELAAARQMVMAWNSYAVDAKSWVLPGFKSGLPAYQQDGAIIPPGNYGGGATIAARFPWRLAPYLGNNFYGMYINEQVAELDRLKDGNYEEYLYFASLYPSLGLNSTWVGGDQDRYGFMSSPPAALKNFYVTRLSSVSHPEKLVVFASARTDATNDNRLVEGYFRLDSPWLATKQWADQYDPSLPASTGNVSFRHERASVCAFAGGGVDMVPLDELRDMRHWANQATSFDWHLTP